MMPTIHVRASSLHRCCKMPSNFAADPQRNVGSMMPFNARPLLSNTKPSRAHAVVTESRYTSSVSNGPSSESSVWQPITVGSSYCVPTGFLSNLQACRDTLHAMSVKDYRYEDPAKDLEKVIALIQGQNAFVLDDILAVVRNAVNCANKQYLKVTTAIRAAEVLSLIQEPLNEAEAKKLRAAANHVASAIDIGFQLDRKSATYSDVINFYVAAERACPTVGKTLIRRRGIAFASRFKELVSYVGPRRGMSAAQAQLLLATLNNLAIDGRLETSTRELDFLAAKSHAVG